jgi:hypothetical protein
MLAKSHGHGKKEKNGRKGRTKNVSLFKAM